MWFLKKPIRVHPLVQLLNKITALRSLPSSDSDTQIEEIRATDIITAASKPETPVSAGQCFETNKVLLGELLTCLQQQQTQGFICQGLSPLYFSAQQKVFFTKPIRLPEPEKSQQLLYSTPVKHIQTISLSEAELEQQVLEQDLQHYSPTVILWQASLFASKGLLTSDLSRQSFFKLKHWPNFARIAHSRTHLKLAAFMANRIERLATIAEKTQTSIADVIDFCNACQVTGILIVSDAASLQQPKAAAKVLSQQQKGLFKRILQRLLQ